MSAKSVFVLFAVIAAVYARPQPQADPQVIHVQVTPAPGQDAAGGVTVIIEAQTPATKIVEVPVPFEVTRIVEVPVPATTEAPTQPPQTAAPETAAPVVVTQAVVVTEAATQATEAATQATEAATQPTTEAPTEPTTIVVPVQTELILDVTAGSTSEPLVVAPHRGDWARGAVYQAGDLVNYDGRVYRAVSQHRADAPNWTPKDARALWALVE